MSSKNLLIFVFFCSCIIALSLREGRSERRLSELENKIDNVILNDNCNNDSIKDYNELRNTRVDSLIEILPDSIVK